MTTPQLDGPRLAPAGGGAPTACRFPPWRYGAGRKRCSGSANGPRSYPTRHSCRPMRRSRAAWRRWGGNGPTCLSATCPLSRAGVKKAAPALDSFLDAELERHGLTSEIACAGQVQQGHDDGSGRGTDTKRQARGHCRLFRCARRSRTCPAWGGASRSAGPWRYGRDSRRCDDHGPRSLGPIRLSVQWHVSRELAAWHRRLASWRHVPQGRVRTRAQPG